MPSGIIVIDKPAGLLTIANEKEKVRTAYHILTDYMREKEKNGRVFVVHRLDRDTSGVVLFAKNEETKLAFQEDWEHRVLRRGYRALVEGVPEKSRDRIVSYLRETRTHLVYSGPPGRDAKEAITRYQVLSSGGGYALLEVDLETGRKNQIRVHMAYIHHPLLGDPVYGPSKNPFGLKGQMLHARVLGFRHPATGEYMEFEAEPPEDFQKVLERLRNKRL